MIEGYAEMTAEQQLEALQALELPEHDTSEVDKWKKQFDQTSHDLAKMKKANKELQDQLNSKLSDDERAKAERDKALEEITAERDALMRESAINKATAQYIALGYSEELAASTANALYDGDLETVLQNTNAFKEGIEQSIRKTIIGSNSAPDGKGGIAKPMTKAEIMAITDTAKRQQAIAEHPDLFK